MKKAFLYVFFSLVFAIGLAAGTASAQDKKISLDSTQQQAGGHCAEGMGSKKLTTGESSGHCAEGGYHEGHYDYPIDHADAPGTVNIFHIENAEEVNIWPGSPTFGPFFKDDVIAIDYGKEGEPLKIKESETDKAVRNHSYPLQKELQKEQLCGDNLFCLDICEDIYHRKRDRHNCNQLQMSFFPSFMEIFDILSNPYDLEDFTPQYVHYYVLQRVLDITPDSILPFINDYNDSERVTLLDWIIGDENLAEIFSSEDTGLQILGSLLDYSHDLSWEVLTLSRERNLFDLIIEYNNEAALEWAHSFVTGQLCENQLYSKDCLQKYCSAASNWNYAEDLLDFEFFENYLDEIIRRKVNQENWRNPNFEDSDDINDYWQKELCKLPEQTGAKLQ